MESEDWSTLVRLLRDGGSNLASLELDGSRVLCLPLQRLRCLLDRFLCHARERVLY